MLSFSSGEDGRDFITVEHCGDDFLAALAESMQTEDWDDQQEMESQACGTLTHVLDKTVDTCADADNDDASRSFFVDIVDDSPQPQRRKGKSHTNVVELDSSGDEDMHCSVSREKPTVTQ